jgi:integrase/recombinase XerD
MVQSYKPCTVNIRLRTLKNFITWLHRGKYIAEDLSVKLKLQKVPKDTIKPLTITVLLQWIAFTLTYLH